MSVWSPKEGQSSTFKTVDELDRLRCFMLGLPMKKKARTIPWGYVQNPDDETMLEPVDYCFELLVEARKHLTESTYADLADWLSDRTGQEISGWGLQKLMTARPPDYRAALPREEREKI